jgi:HAD superfamily hydrolase (TIGR01509 family)
VTPPTLTAVSFDFGQTLAELDTALLAHRIETRGLPASAEALEAAVPTAWLAYNEAVTAGISGHPWKLLMTTLLRRTGMTQSDAVIGDLVDFLWDQQPISNLWRRPVPGMIELVRELRRAGVPVAVLSNSEGRLAELADELGWLDDFVAIADSGRLGMEKPGRAIFEWTAERLGAPLTAVVHVGDSVAADVVGALGAGMSAVWFGATDEQARARFPREYEELRLAAATDAASMTVALRRLGLHWG